MTANTHSQRAEDSDRLRTTLRNDLVAALTSRQSDAVAALRTAIAALDNAEAVPAHSDAGSPASQQIAGSQTGVGSTEAPRRVLSERDMRAILQAEIDDRLTEADRYERHGQADAADRLGREARVLVQYV